MNFKVTAAVLFFGFTRTAAAQVPLTLSETVERGLRTDNVIKTEAARVSSAKAALDQARLSRLGGLKLKSMYTDGDDPVYAFATAMKQGSFSMASMATINDPAPARNFMVGIEAGVPLFTGFALSNAVKMGGLGVEAAQSGYERAKSGKTFKLTYHWLTVLLRRQFAQLATETVTAAETEMKTAQRLMAKGMVPGSDYYGAEAILSTLRGYSLSWKKSLELEEETLGIITGLPGGARAVGELGLPDYQQKERGALAAAASGRRDLKALEKMAEVSELSAKMQKNSLLPVVEAFGAWETNSESLSTFRDNRILGIRLILPIGDPAYFAKKAGAKAATAMARGRLDEARRQAAIELAGSINNYRSAVESLPVAKETLEKAGKSLELFRPLYRQGRQSVLEVLRAQASVLQAEAAYYETLYKITCVSAT